MDLVNLPATQVETLLRLGHLRVEDYVKVLLAHIRDREPKVHAWAHLNEDLVLQQAKRLDALAISDRGPLYGIPIGIKDVFNTEDMPTEHGSPAYKGNHPKVDAAIVATLRSAGALIMGKTCTPEFTIVPQLQPARNPCDLQRSPGDSSTGSAVAVADCHVPLAIGTQTGGSTIRPASFCGVYGFKPTFGAISAEGLKTFSPSYDTPGFFARTIDDLQLISRVFTLPDDKPPKAADVRSSTFAFAKTCYWNSASPGLNKIWNQAIILLRRAGATVEEIDLPHEFANTLEWSECIWNCEGAVSFLADERAMGPKLHPAIRSYFNDDKRCTKTAYIAAQQGMANLRPVMDAVLGRYTAVIAPSAAGEAPIVLDDASYGGNRIFNAMWTGLHVPVLNVPGNFKGPNGLPIGLSLVAPRWQDRYLLEVGKLVEAAFRTAS